MPKKTPRGGKFTTGIKRNKDGSYGGQTYGRRGCLSIILAIMAATIALLMVLCG